MSSDPVFVRALGPSWPTKVGFDGADVRVQVAALTADDDAERTLFYPRSFSYHVSPAGAGTDVHMYGTNPRGETVAVRATGFYPYFFCRLGSVVPERARIEAFTQHLSDVLKVCAAQYPNGGIGWDARKTFQGKATGPDGLPASPVVCWKTCDSIPLKCTGSDRGYNGNVQEKFLQVFMYCPQMVTAAKKVLEWVDSEFPGGYPPGERTTEEGEQFLRAAWTMLTAKRGRDEPTKSAARAAGPKRRKLSDVAKGTAPAAPPADPEGDAGEGDAENPWNDPAVDVVGQDASADEEEEDAKKGKDKKKATFQGYRVQGLINAVAVRGCAGGFFQLLPGRVPELYEADVDFIVRFTIDAGFKPEECVVFTGCARDTGPFLHGDGDEAPYTRGGSVAFSANWTKFSRCPDVSRQNAICPQVCLSFDGEMETGLRMDFPRPDAQRVLQLCCAVFDPVVDPKCERAVRRAFILDGPDAGGVALPPGSGWKASEVFVFASETTLLQAFAGWVLSLQPDMITGWNIEGFDLWYLLERCKGMSLACMKNLCRWPSSEMRAAERTFQSSAHGMHYFKEVTGEGVWVWDLFQAFKRSTSYKLRGYSLEAVSNTFLGDRKDDVSYSEINTLQLSPEGRFKLMRYCMKDAILPARLIGKLTMLVENIELARATGVPIDMICRRGLQIRLQSLLYRSAKASKPVRQLFYTRTKRDRARSSGSYEGAYVYPPVLGYHDVPVVTLDFKSLYPSIMVTKNMCISTLIPGRALAERKRKHGIPEKGGVWELERNAMPGGKEDQPVFLRDTVMPGLVPAILQDFLSRRKRVKVEAAEAEKAGKDSLAAILDKRQLCLKLNCNSIYGVFGAMTSFTECPEIAAGTTATGRDMTLETKRLVEDKFTRANGYPFDATIVYGDTDSVFVRLSREVSIQESAQFGQEMARHVTRHFQDKYGKRPGNIIELEFEKSFSKIIFFAKKRYVGWKWELKFDADAGRKIMKRKPLPEASGMETERRDSCLLVSHGVRDVLSLLLSDTRTGKEALRDVRRYMWDAMIQPLHDGAVPWNLLIQSKQFRKRPEQYREKGLAPPVHIQLAEKLDKRLGEGANGTYQPGDRVQYVVVAEREPGQKASECGESPDYAWEHGLALNKSHYVEKAVHNTFKRILDPVLTVGSGGERLVTKDANSRKRDVSNLYDAFIQGGASEAKRTRIEAPAVVRHGAAAKGKGRGLLAMQGVKKQARCSLCAVLTDAADGICGAHGQGERQAAAAKEAKGKEALLGKRKALWEECRTCVGKGDAEPEKGVALEEATPCKNNSCSVYWERRLNDRARGVRVKK